MQSGELNTQHWNHVGSARMQGQKRLNLPAKAKTSKFLIHSFIALNVKNFRPGESTLYEMELQPVSYSSCVWFNP
jgi:hypothetical protein